MSRSLATALSNAVQGSSLTPIFFVDLEVDSGTERLHTGLGSITWGGNTYTGAGSLAQIGVVEEGTDLSPYGVQLGLSGVDTNIINIALNEDYQQRGCRVYFGVMSDGSLVSDPIEIHYGFLNEMDVTVGGDNGDTVAVTSEDELQILERASNVLYTAAQLQSEYSGDEGLEYLEYLEDAKPVWRGKNSAFVGARRPSFDPYKPYVPGIPINF